DVVGPAVSVEVSARQRSPPPRARGGKPGWRTLLGKTGALIVVKIFYGPPLQCQKEIRPSITVDVAPECGTHHAYFTQSGSHAVGDIFEPSASIDQQRTARR